MNDKLTQKSTDRPSKLPKVKMLTAIGSIISIGFGIWHFFIPGIWNWYSYFNKATTELVIAVRAINIFFSLLLVLLGIANILIVFRKHLDRFSTIVILSVSTILWTTRLILQIVYPQGSQNPVIQYSMLSVFILVFICFLVSLLMVFKKPNQPSPGGSASGRRWLSIGLTFGLLLAAACTDSLPAPRLKIDLAPSLERQRSSYENDVLEAIADVSNFFSSSGFAVPGQRVIDTIHVFETSLAAREYLSRELGAPLEAIPETFAGTVVENSLFLVSRDSYRDIWQQLYPEWPWTERTYHSLIVHEIAHRMHEVIVREQAGSSDAMGPVWFFEGLAVVCAKQFEAEQAPLSREALRQLVGSGHSPKVSYPLYGHIVRTLAAEFGVRRLVSEAAHPDFPEVLWSAPQ